MRCTTYNAEASIDTPETASEAARKRLLSVKGEPLFFADWLRPVFLHFEVPAEILQRDVPFLLDLHEGRAYVSLVAFTMRRMRLTFGGRFGAWLLLPIATNDFLNVRTYVNHRGERGIYFLREWMNNRFSLKLGPTVFGLPYHYGEITYQHFPERGVLRGSVLGKSAAAGFCYQTTSVIAPILAPCPAGSLDEFLSERYTAFTAHGKTRRFFRIWHPPWQQCPVPVEILNADLLRKTWPWFTDARLIGGNYSPGALKVWMGRPQRVGP